MKPFALLFALLFLTGCATPSNDLSTRDEDSNVVDRLVNKQITRERAIEIAQGVDQKASWEAYFEKEFEYEFNGEKRKRAAWMVQALSPAPNTTLWIDAETEEILTLRQSEAPSPTNQQTAVPLMDVPRPEDVCVKPDDTSGIIIDFGKYAGHGTWRVKPGWVVALRALPMSVHLQFPRPVDPSSIQFKVEPSRWQVAEWEYGGVPETGYIFRLLPEGQATSVDGNPGWVSLTVENARAQDGTPLEGFPFSVKFFAYDQNMAGSYPYLGECHGSLAVHFDP